MFIFLMTICHGEIVLLALNSSNRKGYSVLASIFLCATLLQVIFASKNINNSEAKTLIESYTSYRFQDEPRLIYLSEEEAS